MWHAWRRFLSQPWCVPVLTLAGMVLTLPTLGLGLVLDDFIHRRMLLNGSADVPHPGSFFGLFSFLDGQPERVQMLKDSGQAMWWALDTVRLAFWRPLSELTHWLDYLLWPDSPALMHAQSVLWYGLLIALLGRLYRQLLPNIRQAHLATLIFAFSSLHMSVVSWIAARNQLIAACFTVLAITAYHQWRSHDPWRGQGAARHGWLAAGALVLGLLSAEAAVATLGYLVAHALTLDTRRPALQRLGALLPFVLIVLIWHLVYSHLGYGSSGSGAYLDPGSNLPRFAQAAMLRLPTLLLAQLFGVPSSTFNRIATDAQPAYAAAAATAVILVMLALHHFRLWRLATVRFAALGTVLALIPVCAAEPNDRLLLNSEIGMSAMLAVLLAHVAAQHRHFKGWLAGGAKAVVGALMLVHLVAFPLYAASYAYIIDKILAASVQGEALSLPAAPAGQPTHMVLLNPPAAPLVYYYPLMRAHLGLANPSTLRALASGDQPLTLTVLDESTIELSGPRGFIDKLSRDTTTHPFKVGDVAHMGVADVTVQAVSPQGVPLKARVRFQAPLQARQWQFLAWSDKGFVPYALPPIGQTAQLPAVDLGKAIKRQFRSE